MGDIALYAFWIKDPEPQKKPSYKGNPVVIRVDNPKHQPHKMLARPYLNGYGDGTFRPDEPMTWAEAMTVLAKISADYDNGIAYISDYVSMDNYKWHSNYVAYIDKKINLFDVQKPFSPDTAITRKDFSIILAKLLQLLPTSNASGFSDIFDSNLDGYIAILSQRGYINGYPDGTFMPEGWLTRAEIVAIMNRVTGLTTTNEGKISFTDIAPHHWAYDYIMSAVE
ncbi:MAG: S-layer homology domain-containing protein [Firmicutes bacterium]|nr:S-layer homology domain-containing protein [Bacillota bacterium]